jgi:hypothetical protein
MDNAARPFVPFLLTSAALGAAALGAAVRPPPAPRAPRPTPAAIATDAAIPQLPDVANAIADDAEAAALRGLWSRFPDAGGHDDAPVAFYYFHDGGIGLYRYGRIGHNTTNSFHWKVAGNDIELRWNKTGATHRLGHRVDRSGERPVLLLDEDPKNPGVAGSRYTFVPAPLVDAIAPDMGSNDSPVLSANHKTLERLDNRLWMDLQKYATGGLGFALYQLRPQGIDGRGTGWHHVGDFDDWSTEQLTYRATTTAEGRGTLELLFALRGERATTAVQVAHRRASDGGSQRTLTLQQDPRDFGAAHTYVDAGPSFASLPAWIARRP